jgi:hypothetical protein
VLYVVVALQPAAWDGVMLAANKSPDDPTTMAFFRAICGLLPLSAVALAIFALMTESDALWMRIWAFAGVVSILVLTMAGLSMIGGSPPSHLASADKTPVVEK